MKGSKVWRREEPWDFYPRYSIDEEDEQIDDKQKLRAATADQLRRQVAEPLGILQDDLKQADTTRDMIQAIYHFLVAIEVPKILQEKSDQAEKAVILTWPGSISRCGMTLWNCWTSWWKSLEIPK